MDCKQFQDELPDLVLTPNARPSLAAAAHLRVCPPCTEEYLSFQGTLDALDSWRPVEPTPYFDGRLHARVRGLQAAPPMSFLERLQSRFLFNTGRNFRPAAAGALALLLALGSGGIIGLNHHAQAGAQASATVNDLQILDRNAQAFQQMDELQQDDDGNAPTADGARSDQRSHDLTSRF